MSTIKKHVIFRTNPAHTSVGLVFAVWMSAAFIMFAPNGYTQERATVKDNRALVVNGKASKIEQTIQDLHENDVASNTILGVELLRTPYGGAQPRAVVDEQGKLHLVYYKARGRAGDLFYVTKSPWDADWSEPLRVNSAEGTIPRNGTISLAQIALGAYDRIHVTWFEMNGGKYWYTRLNDEKVAFELQRNLVKQNNRGVEAGAALATNGKGNVYVVWHAGDLGDEARRGVYVRSSEDAGKTFGPETRIDSNEKGVCGCCALGAAIDKEDVLYISYRAAGDGIHRDMTLITSMDNGQSFSEKTIDRWELNSCPVTVTSVTANPDQGVVVAWENRKRTYFANVEDLENPIAVGTLPSSGRQKSPAIASDKDGRTLIAWAEGRGWGMGGTLHWQVFGPSGTPINLQGKLTEAASRLSIPEAVVMPDGRFVVIH